MTAAGGLPLTSRAGGVGAHAWSRRWSHDLESTATRRDALQARVDARHGAVRSLTVSPGRVRARVAGTQREPFEVEFEFEPLDDADRSRLAELLAAAPGGLDELDDAAAFLLLPAVHGQVRSSCACPVADRSCRHVVAAGLVLTEALDREPATLLRLRGVREEQILAETRSRADLASVTAWLWSDDCAFPDPPSPGDAGLVDLVDAPVARRLVAAASRDAVEQIRALADLEDCLHACTSPGDDTDGSDEIRVDST